MSQTQRLLSLAAALVAWSAAPACVEEEDSAVEAAAKYAAVLENAVEEQCGCPELWSSSMAETCESSTFEEFNERCREAMADAPTDLSTCWARVEQAFVDCIRGLACTDTDGARQCNDAFNQDIGACPQPDASIDAGACVAHHD